MLNLKKNLNTKGEISTSRIPVLLGTLAFAMMVSDSSVRTSVYEQNEDQVTAH